MIEVPPKTEVPEREIRPFSQLSTTGLLWLINKAVLHPRGFALALDYDSADSDEPLGWSLYGDGKEPWTFAEGIDDSRFAAIEAFLVETAAIIE